jgi:transcriptional regulator with XRE-family HTH domain
MVRIAELWLPQPDKQTRMRTAWLSADDQPETTEMKMFEKIQNPREIRLRLNLNQQEFWGQIGVTQSGGSRYESGRNMPKPVRELLRLVHVDQIDLKKINRGDVALISYLKSAQPALYRRLKTEAGTRIPRRRGRR